MKLRNLKLEDAPRMLEWMHNEDTIRYLRKDFFNMTLSDAQEFILNSCDGANEHLAVVSDKDEYMGTVSLSHIDYQNRDAEFSIVVCPMAMGKGYSWFAIEEMINKSFSKYDIDCIYWCVSEMNHRAIRFYEKHNFHEVKDIPQRILNRYDDVDNLRWYSCLKGDVIDNRSEIVGCQIIHIKTIPTVGAGELSFFEASNDVPFDIKRIYYISKVQEGLRRGFHAHKNLKQLLFCPYGRIQLILENEHGREEIELSDPSIGVVITKPTWREMLWLQKDSVLCVAASEFYDENDYIRDYDVFKKYISR